MPLIPCPVCKGSGKYSYLDIHSRIQCGVCTACKGSKTLNTDSKAWMKRNRHAPANAWMKKDDDYLRKMRLKGVEFTDIAIKLGRTRAAVQTRRIILIQRGEWYYYIDRLVIVRILGHERTGLSPLSHLQRRTF